MVATVNFLFFQVACFHVAMGASLFAGSLSESLHHRIRWMMLAACFALSAAYFRVVWDIRILPAFDSLPFGQLLFYPVIHLPDATAAPAIHEWFARWASLEFTDGLRAMLYSGLFGLGAAASLGGLLKLRASVFEASLATTTRAVERRARIQQGRRIVTVVEQRLRSARLPSFPLFHGAGAIVWKNLVVGRRSRRELALALAFTIVFAVPLTALVWLLHDLMAKGGEIPAREAEGFHAGIAIFVSFLAFLLQRVLPFDFRGDGHHLVGFRTLPVSGITVAVAEIAVPTGLCLVFQGIAVGLLMLFGRFDWTLLLLMLAAYPAIALAVNGIWNLHYLLIATRRAAGHTVSSSAVGTLMVVALSFLVFFPAGWTAQWVFDRLPVFAFGAAGFVFVQYAVDFLLLLLLARLFQNFEVSRDAE